jgi:hypothetical protein
VSQAAWVKAQRGAKAHPPELGAPASGEPGITGRRLRAGPLIRGIEFSKPIV